MLANTMHSAMRACARTLPAAKSLTASSAAARALLARRSFLITPSYKARVAVRGYATATAAKATKTKATKTKTTATKPRATAATTAAKSKKPAAKKAPIKAKAKAKPAAKKTVKKVAKKPKKVVEKKKKKGPSKTEQTLKERELRLGLKKTALFNEEPKQLPSNAWIVFLTENKAKISSKPEEVGQTVPRAFGQSVSRLAASFRNISASERAPYEQKAQVNAAINAANYKEWVESHTVQQICDANLARRRVNRLYPRGKTQPKIIDERLPKRSGSAFALFFKAKFDSAKAKEFGKVSEAMKAIHAEWNALSEAEKKPYNDLVIAKRLQYIKSMEAAGFPAEVINKLEERERQRHLV